MLGAIIRRDRGLLPRRSSRALVQPGTGHANNLVSSRRASSISLPDDSTVLSGIQPTGIPHIGNYFGALHHWVQLQNAAVSSTKLIFQIADLHAITSSYDKDQFPFQKLQTLVTLLAMGLDPQKCTIFFQSMVPAHTELMWIFACTSASVGYISRASQWHSKLELSRDTSPFDDRISLNLGLFSYPVLQAADILVHRTTHVPVGPDQIQHLEFTRKCAARFNSKFGNFFKEPEVLLSCPQRIKSLREPSKKMSKSDSDERSRILLTDSPADIRLKIRLALTDCEKGISYDPKRRPGIANLLQILSFAHGSNQSPNELAIAFKGTDIRILKEAVADSLVAHLRDIRERFEYWIKVPRDQLLDIATEGAGKATINSKNTMDDLRACIGLNINLEAFGHNYNQ